MKNLSSPLSIPYFSIATLSESKRILRRSGR